MATQTASRKERMSTGASANLPQTVISDPLFEVLVDMAPEHLSESVGKLALRHRVFDRRPLTEAEEAKFCVFALVQALVYLNQK